MFEIRTQTEIKANAQQIWAILIDIGGWEDWNPYIRQITGAPVEGNTVRVNVRMPDGAKADFDADVDVVREERRFSWKGGDDRSRIQGEHIFEIEPHGDGGCTFVHREVFTGTQAEELYNEVGASLSAAFEQMNDALKLQAEG